VMAERLDRLGSALPGSSKSAVRERQQSTARNF
jgi:hypothetical protein